MPFGREKPWFLATETTWDDPPTSDSGSNPNGGNTHLYNSLSRLEDIKMPFGRETPPLRGLTISMALNHLRPSWGPILISNPPVRQL